MAGGYNVRLVIQAENLTKKFRSRNLREVKTAVDDLSFKVQTGKVTGFLGPNGAGKSTTMRLLLGLDKGSGSSTYDGKALSSYSNPSNVVGILLEAKAFHPTRTARNHLKVLAAAGGISYKRVDEVLDIVGIKDVAKKGPGKFSLGMSQRLGIAAALLGSPKYLVLDEPANGLDPEGIAWLRKFLKDYARQGNGVLVSSHLLSEMSQMADNVIVIGKGKLIADTSIDGLLSGNKHNQVFVRAKNMTALKKMLQSEKIEFTTSGGGLNISNVQSDKIGELALAAKVALSELTIKEASLEEAFLELTSDTQEFKAGKK